MPEKINAPFYAYKGNEPYIFISYAHKDSDKVFPVIKKFNDAGFNIWYDEGIDPGNEWPLEIERALKNSGMFLVFITPNSVKSRNVRNEINYALSNNLPFLAIYLEDTELIEGLGLQMGSTQAIMKYRMDDNAFYYKSETVFSQMLSGEKTAKTFPAEVEKSKIKRRVNIKKLALFGGGAAVLIIGIVIFIIMFPNNGSMIYDDWGLGISVSYPDKDWEVVGRGHAGDNITMSNYKTGMEILIFDITGDTVKNMADGNDMIPAVECAMEECAESIAHYENILEYSCYIELSTVLLLEGYGGFLFSQNGSESDVDLTDIRFEVHQYGNRILVYVLETPPYYDGKKYNWDNHDKTVKLYEKILNTITIESAAKTIEERVAEMLPK